MDFLHGSLKLFLNKIMFGAHVLNLVMSDAMLVYTVNLFGVMNICANFMKESYFIRFEKKRVNSNSLIRLGKQDGGQKTSIYPKFLVPTQCLRMSCL